MTTTTVTPDDTAQAEALAGRLFNAGYEFLDLLTVYVGDRLGLYRALASDGAATPSELAERAGVHPRYAREWLEQQAVTGILEVDDPAAPEDRRRYVLPLGHAAALTDLDNPFSLSPLARGMVACANVLPVLLDAYRAGTGVPWAAFGPDMYEAQGDFNRPWLRSQFATEHLPAIPDVHARLVADPPARVADFGCGAGWAAIAIAHAYPEVVVNGFDVDEASITIARKNAAHAGLTDRVTFEVADVTDAATTGSYDLVVEIEMVHDLPNPVQALAAIRRVLAPGGSVIAVEENVADHFTPGHPVDRFMYGFSLLACLPVGMAGQPSAAVGTVMRAARFRDYARRAGFREVEVLDIERPLQRFYRLVP